MSFRLGQRVRKIRPSPYAGNPRGRRVPVGSVATVVRKDVSESNRILGCDFVMVVDGFDGLIAGWSFCWEPIDDDRDAYNGTQVTSFDPAIWAPRVTA